MTLKPTKKARNKWHMNRVYTFDIEAYDWVNPIALGMYNGRRNEYSHFLGESCINEFVDEIMKKRYRNCRFVAHNGGKYDFIPVIERICEVANERDIEVQILTKGANNTPFYVRIEDPNGKPRFLQDSMALMPRDLRSLTESFAPDTLKGDFDFDDLQQWNRMKKEKKRELLVYLKQDCISLYEVLQEFTYILLDLTENKCPPQLTVGSTAMNVYRAHFMPDDLTIPDCHKPEWETNPEGQVRKSYFGGRTEVYQRYGKNLNHYDVNSLYPHCYTNRPIPVGNPSHTGTNYPMEDESVGGVLKISGYVPPESCHGIPVLPYRYEGDDMTGERVIFPSGSITGWYTAKEVRYALEVGALENLEILDSYASHYGSPFEDYGNNLYELKKNIDSEKNPGKYKIVKFLLNSFYGKFGMERLHKSMVIGPVTKDFQEGKEMINDRLANKGIMLEEQESDAPYILPRIASSITAQARIEMHKWFMKVFDKGGSLWYCDTDSIVTDIELETGEDLGEMDLEGELAEGIFLAPKVYAEKYQDKEDGEIVKAKGMRQPDIDFDTFRRAYENNEPSLIEAKWETPRGFQAGMKQGEDSWFEVTQQERSLRQFDQKRYYLSDNESKPLELDL